MSVVLLVAPSLSVFARTQGKVVGEISVSGSLGGGDSHFAWLNGERVVGGRTFVSGGLLKTEGAAATVRLSNGGSVRLEPNSAFSLAFSETDITGVLSAGSVDVVASEGVDVRITTPDGVVSNDGAGQNSFRLDIRSGVTKGDVKSGKMLINNGNGPVSLGGQKDDDDDDDDGIPWIPIAIFSAIVGTAVVALYIANRDNVESPSR
jgi:hypothetical protein